MNPPAGIRIMHFPTFTEKLVTGYDSREKKELVPQIMQNASSAFKEYSILHFAPGDQHRYRATLQARFAQIEIDSA